jgi:anti-sigma B factor antagonist
VASFEIAVGNGGDHVVRLAVRGEIDLSTGPELFESVVCAAAAHDRHHIVLDLRDVDFIDSEGLSSILRADRRARELNAHLILCNPSETVQRVFEVTGLDDLLDIRPGWAAPHLTATQTPELSEA